MDTRVKPAYDGSARVLRRRRHRQCGDRLDLLHREARGDVLQRHGADQLLVEHVVALHVRDHDAQHVVDVAGHSVKLNHLRHRADGIGEFAQPGLGMIGALDRDEDRNAEPDLVLVDQGDAAQDHPVGFQPLDPLPARRRRQSDPVADPGDGKRSVFLEHRQDLAVDGIEAAVGFVELDGEIGHGEELCSIYGACHPHIEKILLIQAHYRWLGAGLAAWSWLKSSSTSGRCGAAKAPPKRVHFSAAAAEANRSAVGMSRSSVMASANAPWKISPAPSVSTVWTGKAGVSCGSPFSSSQMVPLGPRVTARKDEVRVAIFFSAFTSSEIPAVDCKASSEKIRCDDAVSSPSRCETVLSTSTTTGMPRLRASWHRLVAKPAQRLSIRIASQSRSSRSVSGSRTFHNPGSRN